MTIEWLLIWRAATSKGWVIGGSCNARSIQAPSDHRIGARFSRLSDRSPGFVRLSGRVTHLGVPDHKMACEGTSRRRPTLRGRVHEAQWSTACAGILDTIL